MKTHKKPARFGPLSKHLRDPETKRDLNRRIFRIVAPTYGFLTRVLSLGADPHWKRLLLRRLPELKAPTCVDLACGTGDIIELLSSKYPDGRLIGIDLSEEMLAEAKFRGNAKNIELYERDMLKTRLSSGCVEIVTGGYSLRNAPDLRASLSEINRIMKPGATGAFLDFSRPGNRISRTLQWGLLWLWCGFWGLVLHGKPAVYGYIPESLARYPDRHSLEIILSEFGFIDVTQRTFLGGFTALTTWRKP